MPPSLAHPEPAPGLPLARGFGRPQAEQTDRWPLPVAGAAILALSVTAWILLFQAGRYAMNLLG